jgi:hypothetical protein
MPSKNAALAGVVAGRVVAAAVVAAAAVALPHDAAANGRGTARIATWSGVIVDKDGERGRVVVTTGRGGTVRTLRTSKRTAARVRAGQLVKLRGERLGDGTYRLRGVRVTGRARRTQVRAAVVDRARGRYLLAAGGSVFSLRTPGSKRTPRASSAAIGAGDLMIAGVRMTSRGLEARHVREVGHVDVLELEGTFEGFRDGVLKLAVEKRGVVEVAVPTDMPVGRPSSGDELELMVSVSSEGSFTLIALDAEEEAGIDFDHERGRVEIEGVIARLTDRWVTVHGRGGASLACRAPQDEVLARFAVSQAVEMKCVLKHGQFVLRELASEAAGWRLEIPARETVPAGQGSAGSPEEDSVAPRVAPHTQVGPHGTSAPDCAEQRLAQVFLPWLDPAHYTLVANGTVESVAGWELSGAVRVSGNESYYVHGSGESFSLSLPAGSSATTAVICVGLEHPTLRFFARNEGSPVSLLGVEVLFEDAMGAVRALSIGKVTGKSSWQPTPPLLVVANLLPLLPGERTPVAFRFTPLDALGDWRIDDVYVDPYRKS